MNKLTTSTAVATRALKLGCMISNAITAIVAFTIAVLIAVLSSKADQPGGNCIPDNIVCTKACPPITPKDAAYPKCWQDCDKQGQACVDAASAQLRKEQAAQRCQSISTDKTYCGDRVEQVWRQNEVAFARRPKNVAESSIRFGIRLPLERR